MPGIMGVMIMYPSRCAAVRLVAYRAVAARASLSCRARATLIFVDDSAAVDGGPDVGDAGVPEPQAAVAPRQERTTTAASRCRSMVGMVPSELTMMGPESPARARTASRAD